MNQEDVIFTKRLQEFADKAYQNSQYVFTGFLGLSEQDLFYKIQRDISYVPVTAFGGTADCERVMLRFGSEELCGYEEPFPIVCLEIKPLVEKFGELLNHRDYLGALMNLGIERSTLGDIIIIEKTAYLFVTEKMSPYIMENLDQVRHTHVSCKEATSIPESTIVNLERKSILVSSERIDLVISKLCNLSRSQSIALFQAKKVFVNGRCYENNSATLKPDDRVSVRGYGKFIYRGKQYETKKGKLSVDVDVYS